MPIDASQLRPNGVRRKIIQSVAVAVETAGNYILAHFPHGCNLIGIWFVPTVAVGTAPSILDLGVASAGETVLKDYSLTHTGSTAGTAVDIFSTGKLLTVLPPGTTLWCNSDGASTGGTGYFIIEYEDAND
jgi:hypothetical protein